ncbi:hypothetical protein [Sphingomonas sp. HMP9]|uniref:hypothetical protein n=1 Tax=Sphingomonas sp. HMP9 TaxID=1517554 RepID=UPI001596A4B1|nr:hypothetical protein [Sphingomonas sp. HMP9]
MRFTCPRPDDRARPSRPCASHFRRQGQRPADLHRERPEAPRVASVAQAIALLEPATPDHPETDIEFDRRLEWAMIGVVSPPPYGNHDDDEE